MEDKNRFIDQLLDSALAHQRGAEPRAGFEARIVESVRAAGRERARAGERWTRPVKLWVAIAATAAVIVAFAAIHVTNRPQSPAVQTSRVSHAVPAPPANERLTANSETTPQPGTTTVIEQSRRIVNHERKTSRRIKAVHWPSQFPSPAPLSNEQKALLQYVRDTPPEVLAKPLLKKDWTTQRVQLEPLQITPLEVSPLAAGSAR